MLHWDETELTEFFGVSATFNDLCQSHSFELSRDGLRLEITLFDLEGAVYVGIHRDELPEPLITIRRELCTHAHITDAHGFRNCFEVGAPEHPVREMGITPILTCGIRVYIEPQFQIELIEPNCDVNVR